MERLMLFTFLNFGCHAGETIEGFVTIYIH